MADEPTTQAAPAGPDLLEAAKAGVKRYEAEAAKADKAGDAVAASQARANAQAEADTVARLEAAGYEAGKPARLPQDP